MKQEIRENDRDIARDLYQATDKQLFEAEKLYLRSGMSWLTAVKSVMLKGELDE